MDGFKRLPSAIIGTNRVYVNLDRTSTSQCRCRSRRFEPTPSHPTAGRVPQLHLSDGDAIDINLGRFGVGSAGLGSAKT